MKHFRKTCMCVLLLKLFALFCITCRFMHCWCGWHCIMLHRMDQGDERRRMYAADDKMYCILLLFTAQRVAPRRSLTLPACKLQNPTGISVMSHRFVSMAVDCPTWMCFYGLWFPFESVPVDPCKRISASTTVSAALTRTAENLSMATVLPVFLFFSPKGQLHFSYFTQLRHMDCICCSIAAESSQIQPPSFSSVCRDQTCSLYLHKQRGLKPGFIDGGSTWICIAFYLDTQYETTYGFKTYYWWQNQEEY